MLMNILMYVRIEDSLMYLALADFTEPNSL